MDLDELYTVIRTPSGLRTALLVNELREPRAFADLILPPSPEAGEQLISALREHQSRPTLPAGKAA